MRVVRTATQRKVQHERCSGDEGEDCSHYSPARVISNCSLCLLFGQYRQQAQIGLNFIAVKEGFSAKRRSESKSHQYVVCLMALIVGGRCRQIGPNSPAFVDGTRNLLFSAHVLPYFR
jgi:hypothetical protein